MLTSLMQAHLELELELERAIRDDSASQIIEEIDKKMTDLDKSIRQTEPANNNEAKAKLKFFLARILTVGGGIVSNKDIATIEELFDHILAGSDDSGRNGPQLKSNNNI